MTLFKQVAITVSIIITILLAEVMYLNYQSSKKEMIQGLYETTVNNISTLSSKIADASSDRAFIVTVINSEFDSGYYKMIDFVSNDGKLDYKQLDNKIVDGVPLWFIEFSDIELESVSADVSSGWSIIGTVSVIGDVGIIHKSLYDMFLNLLFLFTISLSITLIILGILLHFILKPLYKVQNQAEAILKNQFVIQKEIPFTTEFKDVVNGMNAMVMKVEDIFNKGNEAVQRNKELLYNDPITKLFNRRYLMLKLPDLIKIENRANGGTIIFVALGGAEILNQILGRQKADKLFLELANSFNDVCFNYDEKVIARVNGTEFTIILPNCEKDSANKIINNINEKFIKLLQVNKLDSKVFINLGIYKYKPTVTITELLTRTDNALAIAKSKDKDNFHIYEDKDEENAMGKEQWRQIIEDSIQNNLFRLRFWSSVNSKTKEINHKLMTFTIDTGRDKQYFYGDFIAPAINLGLVSKVYLTTLNTLLTKEYEELNGTICSIRLSNEFMKDNKSFNELSNLFEKNSKTLNFKILFEVSDNFAFHNTATLKLFVDLFHKYGFSFGINSFTGESKEFKYLKSLNPRFLKADCAFLLDQSKDSMSAIQVITDSLGIEIIATFVKTQEELKKLEDIHIYNIQGPITDSIN